MAKEPTRRARQGNRQNPTRRLQRAESAIKRVESQIKSTVTTIEVDANFRSHAMIGVIEAHWAPVNTACYHLKNFMPILHNAKDVKAVADILDAHVKKMSDEIDKHKKALDAIEGNSDIVANVSTTNALETKATITSRLGVKVFELLTKADDLLFQADRLSLLDQMSDEEHSAFVAKINKGVRAVCTTIRNQHRRLQNELVRQRNSDAVKAHEHELKKAGVELDAPDADADAADSETTSAKPAAKKTTKKSAKVSDEKDAEQVSENKDEAVAAE